MPSSNAFNATEWIAQNTPGGTELSAGARDAVASFTTMWNFFECTLCENRASVAAFERACERFHTDRVPQATLQALDECLELEGRCSIVVNYLSAAIQKCAKSGNEALS